MTETHQGYANYATFGAALTLGNDRSEWEAIHGQRDHLQEVAAQAESVTEGIWTEAQFVRFELADWIKDRAERACERVTNGMSAAMAQAGLSEVDWEEVADDFINP